MKYEFFHICIFLTKPCAPRVWQIQQDTNKLHMRESCWNTLTSRFNNFLKCCFLHLTKAITYNCTGTVQPHCRPLLLLLCLPLRLLLLLPSRLHLLPPHRVRPWEHHLPPSHPRRPQLPSPGLLGEQRGGGRHRGGRLLHPVQHGLLLHSPRLPLWLDGEPGGGHALRRPATHLPGVQHQWGAGGAVPEWEEGGGEDGAVRCRGACRDLLRPRSYGEQQWRPVKPVSTCVSLNSHKRTSIQSCVIIMY